MQAPSITQSLLSLLLLRDEDRAVENDDDGGVGDEDEDEDDDECGDEYKGVVDTTETLVNFTFFFLGASVLSAVSVSRL